MQTQVEEKCYLRVGLREADRGAGLPVHKAAQSGLSFDDAVWNTHLTAQSRQEHHQLKQGMQSQ